MVEKTTQEKEEFAKFLNNDLCAKLWLRGVYRVNDQITITEESVNKSYLSDLSDSEVYFILRDKLQQLTKK